MKYYDDGYQKGSGSVLLSFLLGGLVGVAAALIFAPKSGRQTRAQIKDMAQDAREKAEEYYDQARSRITSAVQKGAEAFHQKETMPSGIEEEETE